MSRCVLEIYLPNKLLIFERDSFQNYELFVLYS